jgi:hypothetical protein
MLACLQPVNDELAHTMTAQISTASLRFTVDTALDTAF